MSWTADTASSTGWIFESAFCSSPAILNWTRAERRSAEIWPASPAPYGERSDCTFGCLRTASTTSPTTARNGGSSAVAERDCTRTLSPARWLNPAEVRICSAFFVSPEAVSASESERVPTNDPTAIETTQKTSQPITAVFQWFALQRPAR